MSGDKDSVRLAEPSGAVDHEPSRRSFLAHGTIESRAPRLGDPVHDTIAAFRKAWLVFAVVDAEAMLEIAKRPIGLDMIAERGATRLDGLGDHIPNGARQVFE